jgi:hypothetical protein
MISDCDIKDLMFYNETGFQKKIHNYINKFTKPKKIDSTPHPSINRKITEKIIFLQILSPKSHSSQNNQPYDNVTNPMANFQN